MGIFKETEEVTTKLFQETFNAKATHFFKSPGRIELLGNHTDHQGGKTCSLTINSYICAVTCKKSSGTIDVINTSFPFVLHVDDKLNYVVNKSIGTSKAFIEGVVTYFNLKDFKTGPFNAALTSNLPRGAGLSSSAAYAVLFGKILNYYYNDNALSDLDIALAAQYAEMVHFGKPCGLLDQVSISFGGLVFSDFKKSPPHIMSYHQRLPELNYFVIDTGGSHDNLTCHYEQIRKDMKIVSLAFGKELLSEVSDTQFNELIANNRLNLAKRPLNRALHYINEIKRVEAFEKAYHEGNSEEMLTLITNSGASSAYLLENLTYPGDTDKALINHYELLKDHFATKVLGGGFAGALLVATNKNGNREELVQFYESKGLQVPPIYDMEVDKDGASFVETL